MSAPTPISAFLHSATMVKAGVYLLARLHPILGNTGPWMVTLVLVGAATAVWGAVLSLGQSDLKRLLAYTTIMALGVITMFLGGQTAPALTAAITFLLVHALYKSALFMVVGAIDHQAGTRQLDQLSGLWRCMPVTALAAAMAALSMSGFPLFLGFVGKEIMYKGALTEPVFPYLAVSAAVTANALMVAAAAIIAICPFWRARRDKQPVVEAPWQMVVGPVLLSGIGLGFGMIPDWVGRCLVEPAVRAFHPTSEVIQLSLFHGINEPLLLSVLTMVLGISAYWRRDALRQGLERLLTTLPVDMNQVYDGLLDGLARLASWQTHRLQNGSLFQYLVVIIGSLVLGVGLALIHTGLPDRMSLSGTLSIWQAFLVLAMLASLLVVVRARARLLAICALGMVGAGMSIIFLSYGAPDVALTQLLVETLTLVIAAMVLLRLPCIPNYKIDSWVRRTVRLAVALGSGVLVTALLLAVNQAPLDRSLTAFYERASYLQAHGRNIVNVILVDFRGLDTMGEIVVVAASAIAGYALIRKGRDA